MAKDTYLKKIFGEECFNRIRSTKVVMIGAGGIGCELLKDLVLTGYGEIHIVDLDTITLSNLNRQFLFRQKDIDKSKSLTVCKAVESFNYLGVKLVPHHGNVMDTKQFPIDWWSQFSFIFNALDNLEARSYVNRIALFVKKPLMESGTTGYAGQIQPIYPYYSECFDCQPKETPKSFPVCTIRSTPSQPVHCITWAKEFLFHQLFDENESNSLNDAVAIENETDVDAEKENLVKEANELIELRFKIINSDLDEFIKDLITKIFKVDIERLLEIESLWQNRSKPVPLDLYTYADDLQSLLNDKLNESILSADTSVWSVLENIYALYKSGESIQKRLKSGKELFVSFDKDDEDTMIFVTAASNLRSFVFGIPVKSKFDIKQIAGNIIPAIATTNALIAGFSSLVGTEYYQYQNDINSNDFTTIAGKTSSVFISIRPNKYVTGVKLSEPDPKCASDSLTSRGILRISNDDLNKITLGQLVDKLEQKYGYNKEDISIQIGNSKLIYDIDFDDHLDTVLDKVPGISNAEIMLVQDDDDQLENLQLYFSVVHGECNLELPDLNLRSKKIFKSPETKEELEGYPLKEIDGGIIVLDDNESDSGVIEISDNEEDMGPPNKKQRI